MKRPIHTGIACALGLSLALALLWLLGSGLPTARAAGPWYISTTGDDGNDCLSWAKACRNIQTAIISATAGDTLYIAAGTYTENLSINKSLTFIGAGADSTIVDGNRASHVFNITSGDVSISGLTVQNGSVTDGNGGGIYAGGNLTLTDMIIVSNTVTRTSFLLPETDGGGLYVSGNLILSNTRIISNTARDLGGGAYVSSNAALSGGRFENNYGYGGGGLYVRSTLTMTGTQFISNTSAAGGGGIYVHGTAELWDGRFENNIAFPGDGGGAHVYGDLTLTGVEFISNTASEGGGAWVEGDVTLMGGRFERNSCTYWMCLGGGLHVERTLIMTDTQFIGNKAPGSGSDGGGAFAWEATLTGGRFENNQSAHCGGLCANSLALTGTQFISNTASVNGGGAFAVTATLMGGRFESNHCTDTDCIGGGLDVSNVTLTGTQFISNTSAGHGGGLYVEGYYGGSNRVANALFARNSAGGRGAAMYLFDPSRPGGNADILHTTITSPTLGSSAAVYVGNGAVNITNTIIASYTTGISNTGGVVYEDYNLFFGNAITSTGTITSGGHSITGDPAFANPAGNDYHLTATSPAIDRGVNANVATDLDGKPRDLHPDIGAYEFQGVCFAQVNASTMFSSTDATAIQSAVDMASPGGTVKVAGTCAGVQARDGTTQTVYLSKTLTIRGGYTPTLDGWDTPYPITQPTTLDAQGSGRVFLITDTVGATLVDLTVQNGSVGYTYGGGIYAGGSLTLTDVIAISNTTNGYGGGAYVKNYAVLSGGRFENNMAGGYGGGARVNGDLTLTGVEFISNTAGEGGGAHVEGNVTLSDGRFERNSCTQYACLGGGLHVWQSLSMTGTEFISNKAEGGGSNGGGAFVYGIAELSGGSFENNQGTHGGGLFASTLIMTGTLFISNTATHDAGGALVVTATLTGGRFERNSCTMDACLSGGLFVDSVALTDTLFIRNRSAGDGGGLYAYGGTTADVRMVNALFAGNSAGGHGAALYLFHPNYAGGNATILHTTIASPTVGSGAAIYVGKGTVGITNTIVASYTTGISITGGAVYEDYNLFFGNAITCTGTITHGGHSFTGDPAFANPAADDYHITDASLAIERGVDVGVHTDFEGETRPQGLAPDIGYDESPYTIQADLTIGKTGMLSLVGPEAAITYTVVVTNHGPQPAASVIFTDSVPVSTTFQSIVCPSGWSCTAPPVGSAGTITATNPTLTAGVAVTFTIVATVNAATPHAALVTNTATVSSNTPDPTTPNIASVTTTVTTQADLTISMADSPDPVYAEQAITYTVVVTNNGPNLALNVWLTDRVPVSTTFQSIACPTGWSCVTPPIGGTGDITATNPSLSVDAPVILTIVVRLDSRVLDGTLITNEATVSSDAPDPTSPSVATTATTVKWHSICLPIVIRHVRQASGYVSIAWNDR